MSLTRRKFVASTLVGGGALFSNSIGLRPAAGLQTDRKVTHKIPIVDTHQHLWDLEKFKLPWLDGAPEILKKTYGPKEYQMATQGLNLAKAVYMEVDVHPDQQVLEADSLVELCASKSSPTVAAVISGRPNSDKFAEYIRKLSRHRAIKGVRQVLHAPEAKAGLCLEPQFVKSVQLLGELGLSFDLCMRSAELGDAVKLIDRAPGTRFILDHCGNIDPHAFHKGVDDPQAAAKSVQNWKRDIDELSKRTNIVCKISGIVASAKGAKNLAELLAPAINHCLNSFGPERVMFGGDWPVCLLGASYADWVDTLDKIVASRPMSEQQKLYHDNAISFYGLG